MKRRTAIGVPLLGMLAGGWAAWRLARWGVYDVLGLPTPRYRTGVRRNLPVVMPDGVILRTDHYFPRASGPFPSKPGPTCFAIPPARSPPPSR